MKPRPTEYKNVRFRSKSEALFAFYVDTFLNDNDGSTQVAWRYEPQAFRVDEYVPDFLLIEHENEAQRVTWRIIELKPARVTATYKDELHDRFTAMKQLPFVLAMESIDIQVSFELWEGGFYEPKRNSGWWWGQEYGFDERATFCWPDDDVEHVNDIASKVLACRFDLVSR